MPIKGMLIKDYKELKTGTFGWIHINETNGITFEVKDQYYNIFKEYIVELPVSKPSPDELAEKDSCFTKPLDNGFELIYRDESKMYTIYKCKEHARFFLEELRGTIALYSRLILIEETEVMNFDDIYRNYHCISDAMLNYLKIVCYY